MSLPQFDLDGKVALVTGASHGIGRSAALALAQAGADVAVTSRRRPELESLADEIRALGRAAAVFPADLRPVANVQSMVRDVEAHFGRIDILFNNAGATSAQSALDVTEDEWDRVLDTNLKAAFFCAQAVARGMVERRWGKIVNTGSTFSVVARPDRLPYCVSKGGLLQMTRAMALELAAHNIQVNAVGPTATASVGRPDLTTDTPARRAAIARIPAGRVATPEDVVGAVVFLASPASDMITGQLLLVDGGWTIQ